MTAQTLRKRAGTDAAAAKGWWAAHRWLLLRRVAQIAVLTLFLIGPWFGVWIVKGNLNYSYTLNFLPLTDPYVLLQSLLAGHAPERTALVGVAIVVAFYLLVGGRAYCSWVCPVNLVTDLAAWLRERLGIKGGAHISRQTRYGVLAMTLVLAIVTGSIAWELLNPVSMLHRGLFFGIGAAWMVVLGVFLFDLFVSSRGWCGRLCPVGAFYSLIGKAGVVRVTAAKRSVCNDCMDCFTVCPEPAVIKAPLKGEGKGIGPVIMSPNCTNCGRCIDVCAKDVFVFGTRFNQPLTGSAAAEPK